VALTVPVVLVRSLRTRVILVHLGHRVSMPRLCATQLVGLTLSGITPGAAGDLSRAWMWRRGEGIPARTGVAVVVVERIASLVLLVAVGAVLIAPAAGRGAGVAAGIVTGGVVLAATPWVAGLLIAPGRRLEGLGRRAERRLGRRRGEALRVTGAEMLAIVRSPRVGAWFTLLSVVVFTLSGLQVMLIASAVGGGISPAGGTAVYALSQAAGSLSALPFGLGATEAATVGLLSRLGQATDVAGATAILSRIVLTVPVALAAVLVLALDADPVARPRLGAAALVDEGAGDAAAGSHGG
jgi:uncharacterized protein (TIRG00374 family)